MFQIDEKIYSINEIDLLLCNFKARKQKRKDYSYLNVSCSFDIEVSSFYKKTGKKIKKGKELIDEEIKQACMYAFVLGINGKCIIGRTWDEFIYLCNKISNFYKLDINNRLIIYVHNLAYEFQFIRKLFKWEQIFALDEREVCKALTDIGIEFRCSYLLSGYSLSKVGDNLLNYKVKKKVGDLNYSLVRHSKTPLNEKELGYILNDGLVVMAYIQEQIESNHNNITEIPLTKTSYVRRYCRKNCLSSNDKSKRQHNYIQYRQLMNSLQINDEIEYKMLMRAFQGGFTHANAMYSSCVLNNLKSFDECSAYPYAMVSEMYPMSRGEVHQITSEEDFYNSIKKYCCLFDITIYNLESINSIDHPISSSKIRNSEDVLEDNGRVVSAKILTLTITEQDFLVYRKFYKWSKISIKNMIRYKKGYLPTSFIKSILELYKSKTELKNVSGKEAEYMNAKEQLNSCYGMCVTNIMRDSINYDNKTGEWSSSTPNLNEELKKYNSSKNRFLFYPWGVWVTAYARRNLFNAIYEFGNDYCYADTDSVKGMNADKHVPFLQKYNENCIRKLKKAMKFHNLPLDYVMPKTIKGEVKTLGVFELDGEYKKFKTYGAKRYMYEDKNGNITLVVSGLNKKFAVPYLLDQARINNRDVFKEFNKEMFIPAYATGKNIHTYIDEEQSDFITDYLGVQYVYHELSSIHMEGCEYSMSLSKLYFNYLMNIREEVL